MLRFKKINLLRRMLRIEKLNCGYEKIQVLKNVSLSINPGTITVLIGPNGAGKSTLLKALFNMCMIESGSIIFLEENITNMPTHALLELGIAYVPQGKINFSTLTVEENLLLGAHHIEDKSVIIKNLQQIYSEFPVLKQKRHEYAFSLSGGQQQMLAIGRAFINLPKLLLLDEPSLGLSPLLVKQIFTKLKHINQKHNTTLLIVEHNLKSALSIADYGIILVNGEVRAALPGKKLKNSAILKEVFIGTFE